MDPPRHDPPISAAPSVGAIVPQTPSSPLDPPRGTADADRYPARFPRRGTNEELPSPAVPPLPAVDDRLARPETQEEYYHGELRLKMPANRLHAHRHHRLDYVIAAHVAEGWEGVVELLTRTGHDTDFAPDVSIYREPPEDGPRELERLAFEVCSTQNLSVPKGKARDLVRRGVHRVFCIVLGGTQKRKKPTHLLEWSPETDDWKQVGDDAVIEDESLSPAMPVRSLLDATQADDAVARALRDRGNRVFREERAMGFSEGRAEGLEEGEARGRTEGLDEGEAKGSARILLLVLDARGLVTSDEDRQRIQECRDVAQLERWAKRASIVDTVDDLWN